MSNLFGLFIGETPRRTIFVLIWAVIFVLSLALLGGFATYQVRASMRAETDKTIDQFAKSYAGIIATLDVLDAEVTADPCSPQFSAQLRKVAYRPDGLNEFLYAPDGVAQCSVSLGRFAQPVDLGLPDIGLPNPYGLKIWIDRSLEFLDLDGLTGTIVARGSFATVVPAQRLAETAARWMSQEVIFLADDGRWWHRTGEPGVFERVRSAGKAGMLDPLLTGTFRQFSCTLAAIHCVAAEATVPHLFAFGMGSVALALVVAGLVSAWLASGLGAIIRRYWSLEARFRRTFGAKTVSCL